MIKKSILALFLISTSFLAIAIDRNKAIKTNQKIQKSLDFIAIQKEFIQKEPAELENIYQAAKIAIKQSMPENYVQIKTMTKTVVNKILESKQFIAYDSYMSDFQLNLMVKGNLLASEIPSLHPDRALPIKITKLIKKYFNLNLLNNELVRNFLEAYLILKTSGQGTKSLLEKLTYHARILEGSRLAIPIRPLEYN